MIVRVDGHGELTDGYIRRAVELLEETGAANVGGVMDAQGSTPFEEAVAAAYTTKLGLGRHRVPPRRVAGRAGRDRVPRGVPARGLQAVGGFDETMHRAQDWELNHRLLASGRTIWFSPELRVTYRPRSTVRALAKQMYDTGKWRREVIRRYPDTANVRYLAPPLATVAIAAGVALGTVGSVTGSRLLRLAWAAPGATPRSSSGERPSPRAPCPTPPGSACRSSWPSPTCRGEPGSWWAAGQRPSA